MTTESQASRNLVDEALALFAANFEPLARERLAATHGQDWDLDLGYRSPSSLRRAERSISDPLELLGLLIDFPLARSFERTAGASFPEVQEAARQLRRLRNDHGHHLYAFGPLEALRAVEGGTAILHAYDVHSADERLAGLRARASALVGRPVETLREEWRSEYLDALDGQTRGLSTAGMSREVGPRIYEVTLGAVFVVPGISPVARHAETAPGAAEGRDEDELGENGRDGLLSARDLIRARRALLIGEPGAGKTTVLRWVARQMAFPEQEGALPPTPRLPFVVRAPHLAAELALDHSLGLRRYLVHRWSERFGPLAAMSLDDGTATLMIDSLDEAGDDLSRGRVLQAVAAFAADHPAVPVIASSRPQRSRTALLDPPFRVYTIDRFDAPRVAEFVGRWHALTMTPRADDERGPDDLIDEIAAVPAIGELAGNPLLLTIIFLLWLNGTRLPSRRVELYSAMTDTLVREWPLRRMGHGLDARRVLDLLEPLAHEMIEADITEVDERTVLSRFTSGLAALDGLEPVAARDAAAALLRVIEEQTGFFVEVGRAAGEGRYGFIHRTFAEYLAARHLAELWEGGGIDLEVLSHAERWREVLPLLFGHVSATGRARVTRLMRDLLAGGTATERLTARGLRVALAMMAQGVEIDPTLRDQVVRDAIGAYLDAPVDELRERLGSAMAAAARAQPLGPSLALLSPSSVDAALIRVRMARLRLRVDPAGNTSALRTLIDHWDTHAFEGEPDGPHLAEPFVALGGREPAFSRRPTDGESLLVLPEAVLVLPQDAARLAREAGCRVLREQDAHRDPMLLAETPTPFVVDLVERPWPPLDVFLRLIEAGVPFSRVSSLVPPGDTYPADDYIAMVKSLVARAGELPEEALYIFDKWGEAGDDLVEAWEAVARAVARVGLAPARLVALEELHEGLDGVGPTEEDLATLEAAADDADPAVRAWLAGEAPRGPMPPLTLDGTPWPGSAFEPLLSLAERLAVLDPDPRVRGVAQRSLVAAGLARPLAFLADDALFAPSPNPTVLDLWGAVLGALASRAAMGDEEARYAREAMRRLLRAVPSPRSLGDGLGADAGGELLDLALVAATDDEPMARACAAWLLGHIPRAKAVGGVIARLCDDPDEDVRRAASTSLQEVDLGELAWLQDALLALVTHGPSEAVEEFVETAVDLGREADARLAVTAAVTGVFSVVDREAAMRLALAHEG